MIILENDGRVVVVDSHAGGMIRSINDRNGFDLLALGNEPTEELRSVGDLAATGYRGWIDCFPSLESECDTTNGRPDLRLTGHGDLWVREWQLTSQSANELFMSCSLDELKIEYTRAICLTGDALTVTSTITSRAESPVNYVWASHALMAVDESSWIELDDARLLPWPIDSSAPEQLSELWPATTATRFWADLPTGTASKVFLPWPESGVAFFTGGRLRRINLATTGSDQAASLGLWLNKSGFPRDRPLSHFAIEPSIGNADSLTVAKERGTAGILQPRSTTSFEVTISL